MKAKQVGILSAILASTCCIEPLLLLAVGLGSGAASQGVTTGFFSSVASLLSRGVGEISARENNL